MFSFVFGLSACNTDFTNTTETEEKGNVPVYQGMSISSVETDDLRASNMSSVNFPVVKRPGNTDNNGNHNGWYKGDCEGNEEDINQENPFPDNNQDENIENEIESSLVVIGSEKDIYYAKANEDIYINIHINNRDNYEILSFTLNEKNIRVICLKKAQIWKRLF